MKERFFSQKIKKEIGHYDYSYYLTSSFLIIQLKLICKLATTTTITTTKIVFLFVFIHTFLYLYKHLCSRVL